MFLSGGRPHLEVCLPPGGLGVEDVGEEGDQAQLLRRHLAHVEVGVGGVADAVLLPGVLVHQLPHLGGKGGQVRGESAGGWESRVRARTAMPRLAAAPGQPSAGELHAGARVWPPGRRSCCRLAPKGGDRAGLVSGLAGERAPLGEAAAQPSARSQRPPGWPSRGRRCNPAGEQGGHPQAPGAAVGGMEQIACCEAAHSCLCQPRDRLYLQVAVRASPLGQALQSAGAATSPLA